MGEIPWSMLVDTSGHFSSMNLQALQTNSQKFVEKVNDYSLLNFLRQRDNIYAPHFTINSSYDLASIDFAGLRQETISYCMITNVNRPLGVTGTTGTQLPY